MADRQITFAIRRHLQRSHERITHVGNDSAGWVLTVEQVIQRLDSGADTFYVYEKEQRADVYVRKIQGKDPFLQTCFNGDWSDHLLLLPQRPQAWALVA